MYKSLVVIEDSYPRPDEVRESPLAGRVPTTAGGCSSWLAARPEPDYGVVDLGVRR